MYQEVDTRGYHEMPWVYQVSEHVLLELTSIAMTNSPVSVGFCFTSFSEARLHDVADCMASRVVAAERNRRRF